MRDAAAAGLAGAVAASSDAAAGSMGMNACQASGCSSPDQRTMMMTTTRGEGVEAEGRKAADKAVVSVNEVGNHRPAALGTRVTTPQEEGSQDNDALPKSSGRQSGGEEGASEPVVGLVHSDDSPSRVAVITAPLDPKGFLMENRASGSAQRVTSLDHYGRGAHVVAGRLSSIVNPLTKYTPYSTSRGRVSGIPRIGTCITTSEPRNGSKSRHHLNFGTDHPSIRMSASSSSLSSVGSLYKATHVPSVTSVSSASSTAYAANRKHVNSLARSTREGQGTHAAGSIIKQSTAFAAFGEQDDDSSKCSDQENTRLAKHGKVHGTDVGREATNDPSNMHHSCRVSRSKQAGEITSSRLEQHQKPVHLRAHVRPSARF